MTRRITIRLVESDRRGWKWIIMRSGWVLSESKESYRRYSDAKRAALRFSSTIYTQLVSGAGLPVEE